MGVLMYEAVTGQPPFLANNMVEMAQMHIYEKPKEISKIIQDPDFPEWIQKIIFKALEKNVNDRYQTCEEMKQALLGFSKYWLEKTGGGESKSIEVRQRTTTKNLKSEIEAAKALLIAQGIPIPPVLQAAEKAAAEKAAAKAAADPTQAAPAVPPPPVQGAGKVSTSGQIAVPKKVVLAISVVVAILVLVCVLLYVQSMSKPATTTGHWHELEQTGRKALEANNLSEAEGYFFKAMQAARAEGDSDNPDLFRSMSRLAQVFQEEKKYEEAENVLKQTLAGVEQTESPNSAYLVSLLMQLGKLYQVMDRLDDAEKMHQRTMSIVEATFGKDDPRMAEVLSDYAATKEKRGKIAEANAMKKSAEAIRSHKKKSIASELT
jgi:tetratricopeptide (TPR) repeat protein